MRKRRGTKRPTVKKAKVGDLTAKKLKNVKGGMGTASAFIPGAGVISAAITKAK
jgi:hypothetical protein